MLKGIFNKENIKEFVYPLQVLNTIIDSASNKSGVVLNLDSTNKDINIYAKNMAIGTLAFVKYKDLLNSFQIEGNDKIGIINISNFIKYFSIIDDENTEIEFNSSKFFIKDGESEISFQTADIQMIDEAKNNFKGQEWFVEIDFDDKFNKLQKAIKSMVNEEYVFIKGDSQSKKIHFIIRQKDLDANNYKCSFDADVKKDFDIIIKKEYFQNAISISCDSMIFKISDRMISFDCIRKNSVITLYIAKSSK